MARINSNLDVAVKALNGDRSYLTCDTCGCGGNWHYSGCEVGRRRGDTMFIGKGGMADLMMQDGAARKANTVVD